MFFSHSLLFLLPFLSATSSSPTYHDRKTLSLRQSNVTGTYYDVTSSEHEERSKALKKEGYRVLSLSVYGSPPDARYAAVWTKAEGAEFETISAVDEHTYNSWHESWNSKGYVSTHVSATGPAGSAVFAGVMEKSNITEVHRCGMQLPYEYMNVTSEINVAVKGFTVYGEPNNRRYCVVVHENIGNAMQSVIYQVDGTDSKIQQNYDAELHKRYWRPVYFDITNDHLLSYIFMDTSVGEWDAKLNLTKSQLASEIDSQKAKGLTLVQLQGGGDGNNAVYTAIFTKMIEPLPHNWNANGEINAFNDNDAATTQLDEAMRDWMSRNGIRQAQVALSREGKLLGERAFTWAESDRAVVKPTDKMLLGSVSKMFTHAAITRLMDDGLLNISTPVFPLLGYTSPKDPRTSEITVSHLVHHSAGYNRAVSGDIGFEFYDVAIAKNSSKAQTLRDMIEYMVDRPLDFAPGTDIQYSNFGTMVLSYLLTNMTGTPYMDFLKQRVLNGLDVELYTSPIEDHTEDPIVQESSHVNPSPFVPQEDVLIPDVAGGDGAIKEEMVGVMALRASASSIAKFIGTNGEHSPNPH